MTELNDIEALEVRDSSLLSDPVGRITEKLRRYIPGVPRCPIKKFRIIFG
jgi:hypothetical protein